MAFARPLMNYYYYYHYYFGFGLIATIYKNLSSFSICKSKGIKEDFIEEGVLHSGLLKNRRNERCNEGKGIASQAKDVEGSHEPHYLKVYMKEE